MFKMKRIFLILILIFSGIVMAQNTHVYFPKNVDNPLSAKEKAQLEEVYGTNATYVVEKPSLLRTLKDLLRNRIRIMELPYEKAQGSKQLREAIDLSTLPLYKQFNPNLMRDISYNPSTFNILKYDIVLVPIEDTYYKLGNHYFIISPQARK